MLKNRKPRQNRKPKNFQFAEKSKNRDKTELFSILKTKIFKLNKIPKNVFSVNLNAIVANILADLIRDPNFGKKSIVKAIFFRKKMRSESEANTNFFSAKRSRFALQFFALKRIRCCE